MSKYQIILTMNIITQLTHNTEPDDIQRIEVPAHGRFFMVTLIHPHSRRSWNFKSIFISVVHKHLSSL